MEWLYGFVGFIGTICTIYSTIFGVPIISIRIRQKIQSSQQPGSSVPPKSIHWTEWMRIFKEGFDSTTKSIMCWRIFQPHLDAYIKEVSSNFIVHGQSRFRLGQRIDLLDDEQREAFRKEQLETKARMREIRLEREAHIREQVAARVAVSYGCGLLLVGFFLAVALTLIPFILNALTMVLTVMCFLLFVTLSVPYIYHVVRRIEEIQKH